jgi:hypothetical protein|tara:strand:- start:155 stop:1039 length:885 start_codon:yes stop_codon:yes gene_type:complete
MAVNFNIRSNVKKEQLLYENLVIEALKIYGQDVYYLPRDIVNENRVFGHDVPSRFNSSYKIEMYIDNIEGFDGEGDLFTKFGVEIRDEATFVVSRRRWKQTIKYTDNEINSNRPREGDLIYSEMSNKMFEITHVEHEQPFYQLQNVPVFKCRAQLFEFSDEDFDTGIERLDDIDKDYAYTYNLILQNNTDKIRQGMTVTQMLDSAENISITGEVSNYNNTTKVLSLIHVGATDGKFHNFITTRTVSIPGVGGFGITSVAEDNKISNNEQNDDFSTLTDFLDFTENNPFGDPENN